VKSTVVLIAAISGLSLVSDCGTPRETTGVTSGSRTSSPSTLPTAQPSAPAGYTAYVSADLHYSFAYPASWFNVGSNHDGPYYGLNVVSKDIGTPILLTEHDIWFTMAVNVTGAWSSRACGLQPGDFSKATELKVSIDGTQASAYVVPPGGPDGMAGVSGPEIQHEGWCYSFGFITTSVADTNEHLAEIQQIYSTFRFNR
jgi:hypothetical protein